MFHVSHLIPAREDTIPGRIAVPPQPIVIEGEEEFEVERILKERRTRAGVTEFLVRWVGYGEEEDSWQPEYDLEHAQEAIAEFRAHAPVPRRRRKS